MTVNRTNAGIVIAAGLGLGLLSASSARAGQGVTLLNQDRRVTVTTTLDPVGVTASTPDAGPFVATATTLDTVAGTGGIVPVRGTGRIDCQLNPNSLRASGVVAGSGGIGAQGSVPEEGECNIDLRVTFVVTTPTAYSLIASARPAMDATDEFKIRLRDEDHHRDIVDISEGDPAADVVRTGVLQPGEYEVRYKLEGTFDGPEMSRAFGFALDFPGVSAADCNANGIDDYQEIVLSGVADANHNGRLDGCECLADWNGGGLSTQDVFDFVGEWFMGSADFDHDGGTSVQDIFAYLRAWFAGC